MNKDELLKIAKGDINFTFQSIIYALALCLLVAAVFLLEMSVNLQVSLINWYKPYFNKVGLFAFS